MICVLALLTVPVLAASPKSYDSVVVGKSNPAYDIKAIQGAVDQGGTVLLKGTFDFGEDGRVNISKDVRIYGETDAQGAPGTKIQGGFWTFHSPLPAQLPPQAPGPKISIQGIHFEGAQWAPICLPYCGGANIVNNKINKVRPIASKVPIFGKLDLYRQQAIVFVPLYVLPKESRKYQPGAVTGAITVADNDIDLSNDIPEKTMAQGVIIVWATGANIQILRNRVVNCSRNSLETLDNFPGKDGSAMTLFKDNIIVTADKGIPLPTPSTPNGIIAGWFLDLTGASDPARRTKIIVTDNQIETRGDGSIGIAVISDGAVIASNHILLKGGAKAKAIIQFSSDAVIVNNKIEGSGLCAAMLMPFKSLKGDRNTLIGNDFILFKASAANVVLQSSNNVVIGKCGKVIDKGKGNKILAEE
ncbi:MAG: hypothetical protein JRH04_15650 [Deltaproteobacteria bacterium]|nr:hypothetical protein [Deltaproteobacteria bacterium]